MKNLDTKTHTYFVEGMHCASCEVLIEKKLLEKKGVTFADASIKSKSIKIRHSVDTIISLESLNEEFKEEGYTFSKSKVKNISNQLFNVNNGSLKINKDKARSVTKVLMFFFLFLVVFFIFENLQLGQYISVDNNSMLPAFVLLGLAAGVSSCAALIGGLLLSMSKQWNELFITSSSRAEKAQPHIQFHIGRIVSFIIFGGFLGLFGESLNINNLSLVAITTIAVSIVMLMLGLQMLEVSWAQKIKFALPKSLTKKIVDENNFKGKRMPFVLGATTFFLPCGFTLLAQTLALSSGSFLQGALIMLAFSLGTLIPLLFISYSSIMLNSKPSSTAKFNIVAGLIIVFFVIYNINGQLNVLSLPSLSDIDFSQPKKVNSESVLNEAGIQIINIKAQGFSYIPTGATTIKAGISTKIIVDNQGIQGCGAFMAASGLFQDYVELKPGINEIDLGKPQKGNYKLTCTMGMVRPVNITVN